MLVPTFSNFTLYSLQSTFPVIDMFPCVDLNCSAEPCGYSVSSPRTARETPLPASLLFIFTFRVTSLPTGMLVFILRPQNAKLVILDSWVDIFRDRLGEAASSSVQATL